LIESQVVGFSERRDELCDLLLDVGDGLGEGYAVVTMNEGESAWM